MKRNDIHRAGVTAAGIALVMAMAGVAVNSASADPADDNAGCEWAVDAVAVPEEGHIERRPTGETTLEFVRWVETTYTWTGSQADPTQFLPPSEYPNHWNGGIGKPPKDAPYNTIWDQSKNAVYDPATPRTNSLFYWSRVAENKVVDVMADVWVVDIAATDEVGHWECPADPEPTDDPTDNPTDDPTVDPTDDPTVDPVTPDPVVNVLVPAVTPVPAKTVAPADDPAPVAVPAPTPAPTVPVVAVNG